MRKSGLEVERELEFPADVGSAARAVVAWLHEDAASSRWFSPCDETQNGSRRLAELKFLCRFRVKMSNPRNSGATESNKVEFKVFATIGKKTAKRSVKRLAPWRVLDHLDQFDFRLIISAAKAAIV